ncbi:sensor domain-containing protein [Nakamurella endophytica]|uniref:Putative sensor domain-containing protein n=1 Tax=Nakamurella endophytica TaxID=1748367 RepID=A0A917SPP4_9ACTN|nr:sensor domain-containing protein [Nakamurella endophytica]GGL92680.1 hypothetical protein GCM10011594_10550 [Nakamurella endophytica]
MTSPTTHPARPVHPAVSVPLSATTRQVRPVAADRSELPGPVTASAYVLLTLPVGVVAFVVTVLLFTAGVASAAVWLGLPLLVLGLSATRGLARLERVRAATVLGRRVGSPYRAAPPGSAARRWWSRATDPATWRDLLYLAVLLLPLGIAEFTAVVTVWSVGLSLLVLPVWYRFLPEGGVHLGPDGTTFHWLTVDSAWSALPWSCAGLLVVALAVRGTPLLAVAHARLAAALLGRRP